jgi:hypothetical protein
MAGRSLNRLSVDARERILFTDAAISNITWLRRLLPDGRLDDDFVCRLDEPGDDTPWDQTESGPWPQRSGHVFVAGSIAAANGVALPPNTTMGSYSMRMLSVYGESRRWPGFIAPASGLLLAAEDGGPATVALHRVRGSSGTLTVPWRMLNGVSTDYNYRYGVSAVAGQDFAPLSGTVTFADGELVKTVAIPLTNDEFVEPSEEAFMAIGAVGERWLDPGTVSPMAYEPGGDGWPLPGFPIRITDDDSAGLPGRPDDGLRPDIPAEAGIAGIAMQSGGRLILAMGGTPPYIIRLFPDGSRDAAFQPVLTDVTGINEVAVAPDDSILATTSAGAVLRLDAGGQRDHSFGGTGLAMPPVGGTLSGLLSLGDGGFIASTGPGGTWGYRTYPVRFGADGRFDAGFRAANLGGLIQETTPLAAHAGGRLLVRVHLLTGSPFGGPRTWHEFLMRLNSDGSEDGDFARLPVPTFSALASLPDDAFLLLDTTLRRYTAGGVPDALFNVHQVENASGLYSRPLRAVTDAAGRIILTGGFTSMDGWFAPGIVRLLPGGEVDSAFFAGTGFHPGMQPAALLLDPEGNCLAASGGPWEYDGLPVPVLLRIIGGP